MMDGNKKEDFDKQANYWVNKWNDYPVKPGFHLLEVNPRLVKFKDALLGEDASFKHEILVPLCGKTLDMIYLSEFGNVSGVEVAQRAIDQFSEENKIEWDKSKLEASEEKVFFTKRENGNSILIGKYDLFQLPEKWNEKENKTITAVWDRASLVAIQPELRKEYVASIVNQLAPTARILLTTLCYDQSKMDGPPFSVSNEAVDELYCDKFNIEILESNEVIEREQRFKERGLTSFIETTFLLTPKN